MGKIDMPLESRFPISRPRVLIRAARFAAGLYRRGRDLPGAVPGLLAQPRSQILPRLIAVEDLCERSRRAGSALYRPSRHVQVLAALLAEARAAMPETAGVGEGTVARDQPKASGSTALRSTMNAFSASSIPGSRSGA